MIEASSDDPALVHLANVLDLKAASHLHGELMGIRGRHAILDASGVERLGGQCLQVLLSAINTWKADGLSLSFQQPSTAFLQSLEAFGVNQDVRPQQEMLA